MRSRGSEVLSRERKRSVNWNLDAFKLVKEIQNYHFLTVLNLILGDRCTRCGMPIEEYSEDEIGLCLTILETFINEEPALVAPLLPEILLTVSRIARHPQYSWELDSSTFIPSNSRSVARQVLRFLTITHILKSVKYFKKFPGYLCSKSSELRHWLTLIHVQYFCS